MAEQGWKRLLAGGPWFRGEGSYPIAAYSEFMPPPRLGRKPYDGDPATLLDPADPWGWPVTEYEEALELQPGLLHVAEQLLGVLGHLGHCRPAHGIARNKLRDNPCWPAELQERGARAGALRAAFAAGPLAHPGRQGPAALDAFRRQPRGAGPGLLARLLTPRRGGNCRRPGQRISSAGCWRPPIQTPATAWPTSAARGCGYIPARIMPCCPLGARSRSLRGRRHIAGSRGNRCVASATC